MRAPLPIDAVLPEVSKAYANDSRLIVAAPPGAGKTTRLPLHLLKTGALGDGKLLLLEPRRLAARGAAARMASELGEAVGETVGLSTRLERKVSARTRIEVITDGLFVRRLLSDPELTGVSCVVFDEVHERALNVDLGLALSLEAQDVLRDDLRIVLMSATLQTEKIRGRIGGEVITSQGRAHPVETRYLGRPERFVEPPMARAIRTALAATSGSILAFLPGAREIRRTRDLLNDQGLPDDTDVFMLYGALPPKEQDLAVQPAADSRRKIVLSTDIAESAITIEGVSTVIDAGLVRVPVYDPSGRAQRLVTERASLASVDQRRGRAGRTGPGVCYRLWDEAETRGLVPDITPEILRADLSGLVLSLAEWGERDPGNLTWLDPPPPGRMKAGLARLAALGAIDDSGALTDKGRAMAALPMAPHIAALIVSGQTPGERALGADIAALLSERGLGGNATDLTERLQRFRGETSVRAKAMRRQASRWGGGSKPAGDPGQLLARAWPDAIARRRDQGAAQFLTAGGDAVHMPEDDPLARSDWLVVADAMGGQRGARASLVAKVSEADVLVHHPPQAEEVARYNTATGKFSARRIRKIGAIILSESPLPKPSGAAARAALLSALEEEGWEAIGAQDVVDTLAARLSFANRQGAELPRWTAKDLATSAGDWLLPEGGQITAPPKPSEVRAALLAHLGWNDSEALKAAAPETLTLPSGRAASIVYRDEKAPLVTARVQEVYGLQSHPAIGPVRVPVTLSLTSPAGRPVALTADLPGFWIGGYIDMAKDMRARYPKHDWPTDPATAKPHEGRTKARLGR
ncbi:MAG: ATP-dependent helicase HrpB [Pseudomonadota bacterium]